MKYKSFWKNSLEFSSDKQNLSNYLINNDFISCII